MIERLPFVTTLGADMPLGPGMVLVTFDIGDPAVFYRGDNAIVAGA